MKSVTTKFAFASIYILFAVLLISGVSVKYAWSQTQIDESGCYKLTGDAYDLCNSYCNDMKCGTEQQKASDTACDRVEANFHKISDSHIVPLCDPCADLIYDTPANECPCTYKNIPYICWTGTVINDFTPCTNPSCTSEGPTDSCDLISTGADDNDISAGSNSCDYSIYINNNPYGTQCENLDAYHNISKEQVVTCLCRVADYTTQAAAAGANINPPMNIYSCEPPN